MRLLLVVGAVVGGLAFWRRKSLKQDAAKVTDVAKGGVERIKGGSSGVADQVADTASSAADAVEETAGAVADEAADAAGA